ncbi:protein starmaker-like isoform X1 [Lytechinus pictus]|uniref:protein starmaker-like isoform X1 n=1 Tax=Lytechinus pictus TaxID=7653 RepID=UPI0030BA2735
MAEMGVPGRLAFSPTRKKTSARMEYQDEQQNSFVRRDSIVTAASITGDDSGQQGTYCEWINVQFRIRIVTLLRWRSLAQNLGFKGDDQMASYLLNMYYEQNVGSTSRQRKRETPQRSGKVKETVATSLHQANVDRRDVIESEALSIQSQKGERMHVEYLDSMQEGEGPAPRDGWTDDGGDSHGDAVSSKEMVARWTDDGGTHGDAVGSKEMEARWAGDGGDTHGDAVSSKEMEARCTDDGDDTHGDAVSSKEMEARWTDDGDDTHGDAVSSKEMEARWTDDCDDSHGDAVGSKEMEARWTDDCDDSHGDAVGSKEMEARWTDDGDDTHGDAVGSKEMEARWTDDGDDTHGDAVSSKEMEARWTDDTHGDAVSSKEMEARWTDDGDDTHGDAVSSKEMEAQWTDDGDDTHGDAVGSKEMAAYPSDGGELHCFIKQEPEETNSDNDITNKDDTNGLHSNEKEVRSSEDGALKCVIKEEPVDIGEEEPVDFIKKEPVDDDEEGSYLHEVPSCSTQGGNSSMQSTYMNYGDIENRRRLSGDASHDQSHGRHLLEELETLLENHSKPSARASCSSEYDSKLLPRQSDHPQGHSSADNDTISDHDDGRLDGDLAVGCGVKCEIISGDASCDQSHAQGQTATDSAAVSDHNGERLDKDIAMGCGVKCEIISGDVSCDRSHGQGQSSADSATMRDKRSSVNFDSTTKHSSHDCSTRNTEGKGEGSTFLCSICQQEFTSRDSWWRHVKIHLDDRSLTCSICNERFLQTTDLKKHMAVHSGKKQDERSVEDDAGCRSKKCMVFYIQGKKDIGSSMSQESSGQKARKRNHIIEEYYKCYYCDKLFSSSHSLQRHTRSHLEEKPYECSVCKKTFSEDRRLQTHMKIHKNRWPKLKIRYFSDPT